MSEDSHLLTFPKNQIRLLFFSSVAKRSRMAPVVHPYSPTLARSSITNLSSATWRATPDYLGVRGKRQEIRVRWPQHLSQASNWSSHAMKAPRSVCHNTTPKSEAWSPTEYSPQFSGLYRPARSACQDGSGRHLR